MVSIKWAKFFQKCMYNGNLRKQKKNFRFYFISTLFIETTLYNWFIDSWNQYYIRKFFHMNDTYRKGFLQINSELYVCKKMISM